MLNLVLSAIISLVFSVRFGWKSYLIPLFLTASALFELSGYIFGKIYGNNSFIAPLFGLFDYFIWSRFFTLKKSKLRKQLFWVDIILIVYISLELYRIYLGKGFMTISGSSVTYLSLIIIMIYNYLTSFKIESRINWFIFSLVFVYVSFKCFFTLFIQFAVYWESEYVFLLWIPHYILLHFFYPFLLIYLWKIGKNPQHLLFG